MNNISDTIDAIMRDIERGVDKAIAIAYHTSGGAPQATRARVVQQTVSVPRRAPRHERNVRGATLEEMSTPQLLRELRKLAGRYNYASIAKHMKYTRAESNASGLGRGRHWPGVVTDQSVRNWSLGDSEPCDAAVHPLRRFLIKHRDDRDSLNLRPAGLRAGPRG